MGGEGRGGRDGESENENEAGDDDATNLPAGKAPHWDDHFAVPPHNAIVVRGGLDVPEERALHCVVSGRRARGEERGERRPTMRCLSLSESHTV